MFSVTLSIGLLVCFAACVKMQTLERERRGRERESGRVRERKKEREIIMVSIQIQRGNFVLLLLQFKKLSLHG